ncbi:hypothetical protein CEXT_718511 [Caerostris extrusa]|uniref:Uncharacterized protein n=1 Tax=Caerostris extrusa TaxID=172846 RepID=A0AAV4USN7_CAEEX|nr:hypothetical protein CEXT_718511 [Caerostris extrusa]
MFLYTADDCVQHNLSLRSKLRGEHLEEQGSRDLCTGAAHQGGQLHVIMLKLHQAMECLGMQKAALFQWSEDGHFVVTGFSNLKLQEHINSAVITKILYS